MPALHRTPALTFYRALTRAAAPLVPALIARRLKRGKEDPARHGERLGLAASARPPGLLLWIHAASVGETNAVLPLIGELVNQAGVLLTTTTVTAARLAAGKLPPGAIHQFAPVDTPGAAARFLDHWRPDLALFAEQELWPNLIMEAAARGIGLALVNGRMSPRSTRGWLRLRGSAAALLGAFDPVLAQSAADADRLRLLGAVNVLTPGNLKFDAPPPAADPALLEALHLALAGRPTFVAASTQPGEEEPVLAALIRARAARPGLVLLLAPRHPERAGDIAALIRARGLRFARRSAGEWPGADTDVFLVDTIGELGLLYRASALVFMGGSLVPHGGQNPIEPAKLGAFVLHGPHVHNFAEIYDALDVGGGASRIADASVLAEAIEQGLSDPAALAEAGARARVLVEGLGGGLARSLVALEPLLARARGRAR